MCVHETILRVRYVETDQMGIVHHSKYYPWFEIARSEFILKTGMSYRQLEEQGIMLPLRESSCKYFEGAKYDDEIIIETIIKEITGVKIIFDYNVIRKADKKLLAQGSTTHVFVDNNFKIINIKKKSPELFSKLMKIQITKI